MRERRAIVAAHRAEVERQIAQLGKATGAVEPTIYNSDGEEVVFHHVRFPLAADVTQKDAASRLDALPELRKENARFCNWLAARRRPARSPARPRMPWHGT